MAKEAPDAVGWGEEPKVVGSRESRRRYATHVDKTGTEEGERGPFRSFVPWFEAHRSRGPGRTILLDLCARAISRSSRDLPKAMNLALILFCSSRFVFGSFKEHN